MRQVARAPMAIAASPTTRWIDRSWPSPAEPGIYQIALDLSALTAAETCELTIYEAAAPSGTKRLAMRRRITGALSEPIYITPSLLLMDGWDVTLAKIAGTDRSVSWSIRKVA
jgi:hypothetical protein